MAEQQQAIVFYNPNKEIPRRKGARIFDNIDLTPGRNKLNLEDLAILKAHPDYPRFEGWGAISVLADKIPQEPEAISMTKLSADDAIALIPTELNLELLKKWQQEESTGKKRTTVLNTLAMQIAEIEEAKL